MNDQRCVERMYVTAEGKVKEERIKQLKRESMVLYARLIDSTDHPTQE
jgi:hypothetical protein